MSTLSTKKSDTDIKNEIDFETHSLLRSVIDVFLLPVLNNLPSKSQSLIKKTHESAKEIIEYKTTHRALENLYQKGNTHKSKNIIQKVFHSIWFSTANSKAVRNRLKIVKFKLGENLNVIKNDGNTIRILSIASGSARAVIEAVDSLDLDENASIEISFLDKNPKALEYSHDLVVAHKLDESLCYWIEGTAGSFLKKAKEEGQKYDLIEMVGLLDYFTAEKTLELFQNIYEVLKDEGILITANINHNKEVKFITNVVGWEMNYKTSEELADLLVQAGFKKENLDVQVEPFKIHTVIAAKK